MTTVDMLLAVALLLSMLLGAWRGFLYEVLSLVGWVAAFVMAKLFAQDLSEHLPLTGPAQPFRLVAAFVLLFVATAFLGGFVAWLARKLAQKTGLRPVDRVLGAVFGALRALVLLVGFAFVLEFTPWAKDEGWLSSQGGPVLSGLVQHVKTWLPDDFLKVLQ